MIRILYFLMLFSFVVFSSAASHAACSSPVGAEGEMIYNKDHKTPQFCDGTDWWSMKSGGAAASGGGGTDITLQDPYVIGTGTSVAHGLGAAPKYIIWYLENKIAELSYTPGQRIYHFCDDDFSSRGFSVFSDATNVGVNTYTINPKVITSSASCLVITSANWKLGVIVVEN